MTIIPFSEALLDVRLRGSSARKPPIAQCVTSRIYAIGRQPSTVDDDTHFQQGYNAEAAL
ncbi:hypothetical protein M422DRAFT_264234 [Sphaerobolus stellatus SS14]|uniref:Unplaced genomic scaffold SPHSTscaffold_133, whole genome shotgun sequence n=1 Tax=Sphaerobolus stellatus (strain SS14) TaxID=990650 RepID=A0A0C9V8K2_SPHS4|nr:hypothetical protein M422DRAFT_264234 [Sphaerobolus stellatus SS14]